MQSRASVDFVAMAAEPQNLFEQVHETIRLVSFASDSCSSTVTGALQQMGFTIEIVAGDRWLSNREMAPANTIVLLGSAQMDAARLRESLMRSTHPQLLAIERDDALSWDPVIASHCQDIVSWPCETFEFKYRIDRLFRRSEWPREENPPNFLVDALKRCGIVGRSQVFLDAMHDLLQFAAWDVPIFIQGETGTGKELAARAVHDCSKRSNKVFISINCGALPDNLVENELFGHERGAFTDARESQLGLVAQADGGTLFLDEVDTLSPPAQVALLRFLDTLEYRPLGGKGVKVANVRILAATNADLQKLASTGRFRKDLLYRLDVCGVMLPPLRDRRGDVDRLANHFLKRYAKKYRQPPKILHPGMLDWMRDAEWKGNVRELDNMLHRLFLLAKSSQIFVPQPTPGQSTSGCDHVRGIPWRKKSYKDAKKDALDVFERNYLTWLISEASGNLSLAARKTQLQRSSLRRLLQKHGIDKSAWKLEVP